MNLTVNGKAITTEDQTVGAFLTNRKIETQYVIVEINHSVFTSTDDFNQIPLHEGDTLDILHIVGGG